jgi:flagellar motor switch protein FliN/FliY
MPATNPQSSFEGELSQDLIDQMLNGGVATEEAPGADPWGDDTLQAEIDAARAAAGMSVETSTSPAPMPLRANAAPSVPAPAGRSVPAAAPTAVHPVNFMPLTAQIPLAEPGHGIEMLMDVALEVSVELGRSHMSIAEILALRTGSVVELDKLAGEPVDISVNGTLIARGEVVVVDEKFGVRITEVVSKARRLASVA